MEIDDHEIGYIALHVHAAVVDENVSQAMEIARDCPRMYFPGRKRKQEIPSMSCLSAYNV
ncbi:MAG: hypothetical protein ACLTTJ_14090 [Blautia sp.]